MYSRRLLIGGNQKKSLQSRTFSPLKAQSNQSRKISYKWLLINNSILRSIIDFLLIIKNLVSQNQAYKDYKVIFNRSNFFFLTKSYKRLYRVLPIILKATIPIGVVQKIGLPYLAYYTSSQIQVQAFRSIKVFLDLVTLLMFRRSKEVRFLVSLQIYQETIILQSFLYLVFKDLGDKQTTTS